MRIPYWKRVYVRKDRTIWENVNNKKRVYVVKDRNNVSWDFGNYEKLIIYFNDKPTANKHINQVRNRKAAFDYAVKYMRDNPK